MKMMPSKRLLGFTLLEVLVVISLLSLVMLALGSSLRTVAQTQERIDARLARMDERRVAVAFIRATLGRVSARTIQLPPTAPVGSSRFHFATAPDALAWVGVMPARFGAGGRYFFRLALERLNGEDGALVIRFTPWEDESHFPDWATADSRVLVTHVTSFSIRYENPLIEPPEWSSDWTVPDSLPDKAMIELQTASGDWPALVIPLRQLPRSNGRNNEFSVGGGRRQ